MECVANVAMNTAFVPTDVKIAIATAAAGRIAVAAGIYNMDVAAIPSIESIVVAD